MPGLTWFYNLAINHTIIGLILIVVGYIVLVGFFLYCNDFPRKRKYCTSTVKLNGKTVIVTGANAGIGFETAKDFAKRGARVILACRNMTKANKACEQIKDATGNNDVVVMQCDLSDLESVQHFGKEFLAKENNLHILVNNAGIGEDPKPTRQNYNGTVATNYVGPFLLTYLLLDKLKECAPSRIVNVSSVGHLGARDLGLQEVDENGLKFPQWYLYFKSKLLGILHVRELARQLEGTGVTTYAIHPGYIYSSLFEGIKAESKIAYYICLLFKWCAITAEQGAQTSVFCAVDESLSSSSGKYYNNCREQLPSKLARDNDLTRRVWDLTLKSMSEFTDIKSI